MIVMLMLIVDHNVKKKRLSVPKTTGQGQRKARQNTGNDGLLQGGQSDETTQLISTCVLVVQGRATAIA